MTLATVIRSGGDALMMRRTGRHGTTIIQNNESVKCRINENYCDLDRMSTTGESVYIEEDRDGELGTTGESIPGVHTDTEESILGATEESIVGVEVTGDGQVEEEASHWIGGQSPKVPDGYSTGRILTSGPDLNVLSIKPKPNSRLHLEGKLLYDRHDWLTPLRGYE